MATPKLKIFAHHQRDWRDNRYVYPVVSRRSGGLSIGINLNPDTACNFDCVYCCVDRTVEPRYRRVELDLVRVELERMLDLAASGALFSEPPLDQTPSRLRRLNDVAFSGNGEPTAYRRFGEACHLVADVLAARNLRDVKIVVITNATLFHRPAVADALRFLDDHNGEIWAKLDAGAQEYYARVERTTIPLSRVVDNIILAARLRPLVIQSLFITLDGVGPDDIEVEAYVARLRQIVSAGGRIKLVQVYTVARRTAESNVGAMDDAALDAIAAKARATGVAVETYYGLG
jgi:wyosine [tRNA(Phe)-imidazoG37] synthetase (radical SAM superfamily)